jgi:hypothetical protein
MINGLLFPYSSPIYKRPAHCPRFKITWFLGDPVLEPLNKAAASMMNEHLEQILKQSL